MKAGEELTCDYGYEHKIKGTNIDDLPPWFHAGIAYHRSKRDIV